MNNLTREKRILKAIIKKSVKKNIFNSSTFFTSWFDEKGKSCYFLFKNNKNVTNTQFVELIALTKRFSSINKYHLSPVILSVEEFKDTLENLIDTFFSKDFSELKIRKFVNTYFDLLLNAIVISPLQGSATIHLNPFTKINLQAICCNSGYIHSCGNAIFIRNAEKIEYKDFLSSLKNHFSKFSRIKKLIPFIVYAHEDFTNYDRNETIFLKNGLDDVKIYISKYFFKELSIDDVLIKLEKDLKKYCLFPKPGNYKSFTSEKQIQKNVLKHKAIWLVSDKGIFGTSDKSRYFCCYEQLYINRNPFHLFDENKPGWNNHITIPHTLAGAILNISLSNLFANKESISICDPFAGSSTFLIEALKYKNVILYGFDIDRIGIQMLLDNEEFFNLNELQYNALVKWLNKIKSHLEFINRNEKKDEKYIDHLSKFKNNEIGNLNECIDLAFDYEFKDKKIAVLKIIKGKDLFFKILFYTILKVIIRHQKNLFRGSEKLNTSIVLEIQELVQPVKKLSKLSDKIASSSIEHEFIDSYSVGTNPYSKKIDFSIINYNNQDALKLKKNKYDLIITDPPYGYNTKEENENFAIFYQKLLPVLIESLNSNGVITLCLPAKSFTGKIIPLYINPDFITNSILLYCKQKKYNVINFAESLPFPSILKFPYYWESQKAIRREILIFQILKTL